MILTMYGMFFQDTKQIYSVENVFMLFSVCVICTHVCKVFISFSFTFFVFIFFFSSLLYLNPHCAFFHLSDFSHCSFFIWILLHTPFYVFVWIKYTAWSSELCMGISLYDMYVWEYTYYMSSMFQWPTDTELSNLIKYVNI